MPSAATAAPPASFSTARVLPQNERAPYTRAPEAAPAARGTATAARGTATEARGTATEASYRALLRLARRFTRTEDDARDLLQDAVLFAVTRGYDWTSPERQSWLRGVLRQHAAFVVRGEQRRRRREALVGAAPAPEPPQRWVWRADFLHSLPPSLRALALLLSVDLGAAEISWLLGLSATALRQRVSALKRLVEAEPEPPKVTTTTPPEELGARRAPVIEALRRQGGRVVATHDPDGHAVFLRVGAHTSRGSGNG